MQMHTHITQQPSTSPRRIMDTIAIPGRTPPHETVPLISNPERRIAIGGAALAAALFAALFCTASAHTAHAQSPATQAASSRNTQPWQQNLMAWRSQHEAQVSARDGWLTLAGLDWLKSGVNTIGSAPGNTIHLPDQAPAHLGMLTVMGGGPSTKSSDATVVQLLSPAGGFPPDFTVDDRPAREGPLQVTGADASVMAWHGLNLTVLKRGDRFVLRTMNADSPLRSNFKGLNWYAPDPEYRVTARWIPFKPPVIQEISTVIGTTLKLPAPGLAMFMLNGKIMQLEPVLEDPAGKELFFVLRDETSKTTTYGGGRFLHTGLPDHGLGEPGNLVLDFNQLENPPCAYTSYATCPLPPQQNELETGIQAGEKRYEK